MKSSTRLDSAIFQLTPTRTRCDLVITANGKTEKIATGLLNPFLAHLKTAQEQIAKGGYSVALEPEPGSDRTWFTKGTVERFVRFVSTPEILERVYTIESEILQIEKAIAIQGNNHIGLSTVEEYQAKPVVSSEDSKTVVDANEEKAIVLYKPDSHPPEANGSPTKEGNSKVQLLKVLETRKAVLQKEQGMAFARAAAAGFDVDLMTSLVSFAECFGASRMMDACLRFMDLWKQKHETGQWVEIEAAEAMSGRSEFSAMNASGILLSSMTNKQNESHVGFVSEDNGQTGINSGAEERHPMEHSVGQQEYFQNQFPHPMYPPWPIYSPPGALPVFQPYPVQGYYQNYPGNGPFYPPPPDDYRFNVDHRAGHKSQSMDSRDGITESEAWQVDPSKTRPQGDLELENESRKKAGRSVKTKSGTVVIRNINYIASKKQNSSCSESPSASDSEMDKEIKRDVKSMDESNLYGTETEGGDWLAFQDSLLKDTDERKQAVDQGMFDSEKNVQMRRWKNVVGDDSLADLRHSVEAQDGRMTELHTDPLAVNEFRHAANNLDKNSLQDMTDESFIVPVRPMSLDQVGNGYRTAIDIDSELPRITESNSNWIGTQVNYEPYELSLMPERGMEKNNFGYDLALDYEMQVHVGDACAVGNLNKELADVKKGSKKSDRKSKVAPDSLGKKKTIGPIKKEKPSKLSPLDDARVRAEKLRIYKADLQKMKKEKEEEDRKRLEALKMERQKRIAARACSNSTQSPSSGQSKKQLPLKLSLSSVRGLKFSDSEPGSSSPLQRSKIRTASLGSNEFQKASKISKSSNGSQVPGNEMTTSVSSLPESKISMVRIRRLSEPKTMRNSYVAPVKNPGAELVSKRKVSKVSTEPESKKISAIINLDRSKAATLPQLKIRTSKVSSDVDQNKSALIEMTQKVNEIRSSVTSSNTELSTHQNVVDDNPVIDKTIVMLECEKPSSHVVHSSEKNTGVRNQHCGNRDKVERNDMISDYPAIHVRASSMDGVIETVESQIQEQPRFHTVTFAEKDPQNSSSICASEKPYQAPFARLSSLEPYSENSKNDKAPSTKLAMPTIGVETAKRQISDFEHPKLAMIPESLAKVQVKESPKGLKRLLMFGKKNHSSGAGEHGVEVNNGSLTDSELDSNATNAASSSEVHILKNLISQDEASSQKSSRHFSLLSPFRTKTCEKKLTS